MIVTDLPLKYDENNIIKGELPLYFDKLNILSGFYQNFSSEKKIEN